MDKIRSLELRLGLFVELKFIDKLVCTPFQRVLPSSKVFFQVLKVSHLHQGNFPENWSELTDKRFKLD
jgi:hypothetical protein